MEFESFRRTIQQLASEVKTMKREREPRENWNWVNLK